MAQLIRRQYLVSGRVQGVGFRNFVFQQASELGLKGAVRNLEDGRVEILVRGEEPAMASFDQAVARGPSHAKVASLDVIDLATLPLPLLDGAKKFTVVEDGVEPWSPEASQKS